LRFVATDLEIQILTRCAIAKGGTDDSLTVSARKLQDILRSLPDESKVALEAQNNRLQVRAGKSRFNLQTLPATDFPLLGDAGPALATVSVSQKTLKDLFLLVQFAMAQQDIRYYLNGMLLVLEKEQMRVVATDGHRLSYASGAVGVQSEKREVIIPRKAVLELSRLLSENDEAVEVEVYSNQVKFRFGEIELTTKVIDGKFPDYTRVIPPNYQKHFKVDRIALLQALQRAAILSNEKFRGVRWMLTGNSLRISCTNNEQEEAQEEVEITYTGDPLDVGFNITYLLDVLNNVDSAEIDCAFGDASSSMLITLPDRADFRYVVMPMRI
jgi:DNA polymerase-3 subunit beta